MDDVRDRVAFVTGGASGIGLGIARALVDAGARVVIADLRPDHLDTAMASFGRAGDGARVHPIVLDVTDREAMAAAVAEVDARFGGTDILVNNAGVGVEGPIREATFADWDFGLGVNLGGVVNGIQCFLPGMIARARGGHIVNTASLAGTVAMPSHFTIYATGKAAVIALSEAIRADLAQDGIGVSVLCPGFVRTNIHEAGRNRPERFREGSGFGAAEAALAERQAGNDWMDPDEAGRIVLRGIRDDQLYIVTHGDFREQMRARVDALLAATPPAPPDGASS